MKTPQPQRFCCLFFHVGFVAVLVVFFLKGVLLVGRYGITAVGKKCERINVTSDVMEHAIEYGVNNEFVFTTIVYGILSVLRFFEYLILGWHMWYFLFRQDGISIRAFFTKIPKRFQYLAWFVAILLPSFLLGAIIPSLGIYQEMQYKRQSCSNGYFYGVFVAYCIVNYFRYFLALGVRLMMMFTVLALSRYWSIEDDQPHRETDNNIICYPLTIPLEEIAGDEKQQELVNGNSSDGVDEIDASEEVQLIQSQAVSEVMGQSASVIIVESQSEVVISCDTNQKFQKVLCDWKSVSADFQKRIERYLSTGKDVRVINRIFQTWFIIPWVVYFIASSLKTSNILRPWSTEEDGVTHYPTVPQIYYFLYNVNQFITLVIPYVCVRMMNIYHQKYHGILRSEQLEKFRSDPSRLAFARQLVIEKEEDFDFMPHIVGTNITISIGSPLYVVILLGGLVISVSRVLFDLK